MFKIKVIAVGKCKEEWLKMAIAEYEKRLSHTTEISWIQSDELEKAIKTETQFIALSPNGKLHDSIDFSKTIMSMLENNYSRITFVIGGPEGLSEDILKKARMVLSLSPMTFTHQLTRLILIEQIYRAFEIAKSSPYHK
jgi:23S rRNA (pseudouridine1915-N3)-methyltransferase